MCPNKKRMWHQNPFQKINEWSTTFQALEDSDDEDTFDDEEDKDKPSFLSKKIARIWKRKPSSKKGFTQKNDNKSNSSKVELACYECKELGHIGHNCPRLKRFKRRKP